MRPAVCRAWAGHARPVEVEKGRKEVGRLAEQLAGNLPACQRASGAGRGRSRSGRPRGAQGARQTLGQDGDAWCRVSPFFGDYLAPSPGHILDKSWTHLGRRRDGEKPEGCRRLGVGRPPEKIRGVGWGVLRPSIVGGARVAVVFNPRLYWQNLSGATHTRNVSACRAKRGEKRYRRARPKVGRSG